MGHVQRAARATFSAFLSLEALSLLLAVVSLALLLDGPPPPGTSLANGAGFLYLGLVGTALAYAPWFRGIGRLPASSVSFLGLLSPLVAAALGFLVLDEAPAPAQPLGAGLVFASALLGQSAGKAGGSKRAVGGGLLPSSVWEREATRARVEGKGPGFR